VKVYVDSSVVLRIIFGESGRLAMWDDIEESIASVLLHVECYRSIDRARVARAADSEKILTYRNATSSVLERITLVDVTSTVIARAVQPLAFVIRTLDAIHLATALQWREQHDRDIAFATHDRSLGEAARATGFRVLGL
jgi:predicted nucleic acid-binding protein